MHKKTESTVTKKVNSTSSNTSDLSSKQVFDSRRSRSETALMPQSPISLKHFQVQASSMENLLEVSSPGLSQRSSLSNFDAVEAVSAANQVNSSLHLEENREEQIKQEEVMSSVPSAYLAECKSQQGKMSEYDYDVSTTAALSKDYWSSHRNSMGIVEVEYHSPTEEPENQMSSFYTKYPLRFPPGYSLGKYRHNLKLSYQTLSQRLEGFIFSLQEACEQEHCRILMDILQLIKEAWDTPVYGRDLAYGLCDIMRMEGLVDMLIHNCSLLDNQKVLLHSANLLEQVMSVRNRERVARKGLEIVVQMAKRYGEDQQMALAITGILENLFKLSEETCTKVINLGGLDVILRWCRCSTDSQILRRCAKALANLSLFGGAENQEVMSKHNVPEWLFPLAFSDDNSVRYYACLAISALVANKELEASVTKSGTLELVLPFINSTQPSVFAQSDITHKQGRDNIWLKHLIPLLFSRRPEPQALAAFHFAMEAIIKAEQCRQEVFHEIDAVEPLKKIASSPNTVASKLAAQALKVIGEKIPHKLSQQVPLWSVEDVAYWVSQIGFPEYVEAFQSSQVDGDLLLILTMEDLSEGLGMTSCIVRKRFMRELKSLKITADYSVSDPTGLDKWLMGLCPELSQYTYFMLRQGVDTFVLKKLTDQELRVECGIQNSIHRRKIMENVGELNPSAGPCVPMAPFSACCLPIDLSASSASIIRPVDVFICYRRSSGSQLASLLKVHLQLRGFSVFLDIDRLRAGKFDENLLLSIRMSHHFVLVLTPDALDRCIDDVMQEDWVHKEIASALEYGRNIIPIMDNFTWPPLENLPKDMQDIVRFNCVSWVHEYQDACVDKLVTFLRRSQRRMSQQVPPPSSCQQLGSESHLSELSLLSQSSGHSSRSVLDVCSP